MGMFDSVMIGCPKCGNVEEFQSKGGDCLLRRFNLDDAPADVMSDINRHSPHVCSKCGTLFEVKCKFKVISEVVVYDKSHFEEDDDEFDY